MIHPFANDYQVWYNTYKAEELIATPNYIDKIFAADNPKNKHICFRISYTGVSRKYCGQIATDGVRYAYIIDEHIIPDMLEPQLNLYCRSQIRLVIREFLDSMEMWPL